MVRSSFCHGCGFGRLLYRAALVGVLAGNFARPTVAAAATATAPATASVRAGCAFAYLFNVRMLHNHGLNGGLDDFLAGCGGVLTRAALRAVGVRVTVAAVASAPPIA